MLVDVPKLVWSQAYSTLWHPTLLDQLRRGDTIQESTKPASQSASEQQLDRSFSASFRMTVEDLDECVQPNAQDVVLGFKVLDEHTPWFRATPRHTQSAPDVLAQGAASTDGIGVMCIDASSKTKVLPKPGSSNL